MKLSATRPTLFLTPDVDQRIRHLVDLAAGEVSGLGLAKQVSGGFLVTSVHVPIQRCGPAETELDQASICQLVHELDAAGKDLGQLRFWWHSHGSMKTWFSGTDEATIRALANDDWTISLVVNRAGDQQARIDVWRPVHITLDELPVSVFHDDHGLRAECERLFKDRVTEVSVPLLSTDRGGLSRADAERQGLLDDRLDPHSPQARYPGLDWSDLDDLLDPTLDDARGSRVGP